MRTGITPNTDTFHDLKIPLSHCTNYFWCTLFIEPKTFHMVVFNWRLKVVPYQNIPIRQTRKTCNKRKYPSYINIKSNQMKCIYIKSNKWKIKFKIFEFVINSRLKTFLCFKRLHCVKSVQIRSYFWFVFSYIRTEYGDLLRKSPYLVRIQENTNHK